VLQQVLQAKSITGSVTPKCVFLGDNVVQDVLAPSVLRKSPPLVDTVAVISDLKSRAASIKNWGPIPYGADYDESLVGGIVRRYSMYSVNSLPDLF
jgi:hypothetical protein